MMIFGDFNEIINLQERKGCNKILVGMCDFKDWVVVVNILELFLSDRKYIWRRKNFMSRIDRVFVDLEWFNFFLDLIL